jgi:hypothetical protein
MKEIVVCRSEYLDILEKRVRGLKEGYRQNISFIGDEMVGKTSLVHQFLGRFCDNHFLMLYVECHPESLSAFCRRFIGVLLYAFLLPSGIPLKEDIDFLIEKSAAHIPGTVEKIRALLADLEKKKKESVFTQLSCLCDSVYQETGKFCVVFLDEFQNLESLGVKNLYKEWAQQLILQKTTMYVVISSQRFKAQNVLAKNLSLLFGNFEIIDVEPFDSRTSEAYLEQRLAGVSLPAGHLDFLVHFTGGNPFYLKVICDALSGCASPNLVDVLESLLFSSSGVMNLRFQTTLKRFQDTPCAKEYVQLLHLVSSGHNKLKDIAHMLHKSQKEITVRIGFLLETDVISRSGDFLTINDRVFSYWLRFVYQGKTTAFTFDAQSQHASFRKSIEAMIQDFFVCLQKPVSERISEVLKLFGDDRIQVEKKKLRLTHFREIKPVEFNARGLKDGLICRSQDSLWVIAFKNEQMTEEDIAEFSRECKKYRHKLERKIIVSLEDLDVNSRLRALEEKIWTWDVGDLNRLFDLFSKPRIVQPV